MNFYILHRNHYFLHMLFRRKQMMKNSERSHSSLEHHSQRNDDNFSEVTGRSISLKILEME